MSFAFAPSSLFWPVYPPKSNDQTHFVFGLHLAATGGSSLELKF
jgi:hypothetical protein